MIVTAHQPNFFPFYPIFQKMVESDVFVIIENCQFEKNNYQNRFHIGDIWYTMSVNKGLDPIHTKKYVFHEKDWNRIKNTLPKYKEVLNLFNDCLSDNLSEMNSNIIRKSANILGIDTKIVMDYPTDLVGTDRLVDICVKNNATTYLSGISGAKYLELNKFEEYNIKVVFQDESKMIKRPLVDMLLEKIK